MVLHSFIAIPIVSVDNIVFFSKKKKKGSLGVNVDGEPSELIAHNVTIVFLFPRATPAVLVSVELANFVSGNIVEVTCMSIHSQDQMAALINVVCRWQLDCTGR
jgi:hypothetical protein